jgi:hypothetical protein
MNARIALLASLLLAGLPAAARAHCDTLDGPVVQSARAALETGKLNPVLAWVRPGDEAEVQGAFARALAVRKLGPQARELADTSFLETVVRVHRAGEGAPYTGLEPAGQDLGPAVPAADRAIGTRSAEEVERILVEAVRHGLHRHFARVASRARPGEDVAQGREWVEAYVRYVHWVEGVYQAAAGGGAHGEAAAGPHGHGEPAAHGHGEAPAGHGRAEAAAPHGHGH